MLHWTYPNGQFILLLFEYHILVIFVRIVYYSVIGTKSNGLYLYKSNGMRVGVPFAMQGLGDNFDSVLLYGPSSSDGDGQRGANTSLWPPMKREVFIANNKKENKKSNSTSVSLHRRRGSNSSSNQSSQNGTPTMSEGSRKGMQSGSRSHGAGVSAVPPIHASFGTAREKALSPPTTPREGGKEVDMLVESMNESRQRRRSNTDVSGVSEETSMISSVSNNSDMQKQGLNEVISALEAGRSPEKNIGKSMRSAAPTPPRVSKSGKQSQRNRSDSSSTVVSSIPGGSNVNGKRSSDKNASVYSSTDEHLLATQLFTLVPEPKLLLSCGHWDHSFRITSIETGKLVQSVNQHSDVVTCVAWTQDFGKYWVVTGSRDCTVMVWDLGAADKDSPLSAHPLQVLYGHNDAISTVALSAEHDVVLSGSADGTIIIHTLREGIYTRSIVVDSTKAVFSENIPVNSTGLTRIPSLVPEDSSTARQQTSSKRVTWIGYSSTEGLIIAYCADDNLLCTYTVNGRLLAQKEIDETLGCLILSEDGNILVTGGSHCLVVFRWARTLQMADDGARKGMVHVVDGSSESMSLTPFATPIRSLLLTARERHLVVGLESGEMRILAQDPEYLRYRLHQHLHEIGIL